MSVRRALVRTGRLVAAPLVAAHGLAGCSGPQSMLDPAGPAAQTVATLWWWMAGFSALVLALVCILWLRAMRRAPREHTPREEQRIAARWIVGGGLMLPMFSIVALLAFGLPAGQRLLPGQGDAEPLRIEAIAHQWWWEIRYPGVDESLVNEFRLPVGRPVDVHTTSRDVIHSFWIPSLGGKIDAIPGRTNILRLEASREGRLRGTCAEFCGLEHARMNLDVHVMDSADFDRWLGERQGVAQP